MYGNVVDYIEMREWVLIAILMGLFLFLSIISYTRLERIEATVLEIPTPVTMLYLGYPFEMIAFEQLTGVIGARASGGAEGSPPLESLASHVVDTQIFWNGLFLNLLLYFLSAFVLVYLVARLTKRA
jgi:hypothetical protein